MEKMHKGCIETIMPRISIELRLEIEASCLVDNLTQNYWLIINLYGN